jgi:hypothetical protein
MSPCQLRRSAYDNFGPSTTASASTTRQFCAVTIQPKDDGLSPEEEASLRAAILNLDGRGASQSAYLKAMESLVVAALSEFAMSADDASARAEILMGRGLDVGHQDSPDRAYDLLNEHLERIAKFIKTIRP